MKVIFFKLFLILIIVFSFSLFQIDRQQFNKIFSGQSQDVYVNVKIDNQEQKVELDNYLLGVVAGEMPASYEMEAIKAQVVASRTYVYSRLLSVDNTTASQVYLTDEQMQKSWQGKYEEYKKKIQSAIQQTQGEIMTYHGECISALFYNSSNGKSENVENYFTGGKKDYLVSVDSHWDEQYDQSFVRQKVFTQKQLDQIFGKFVYQNMTYYPSGRVKTLDINYKTYTGREVRERLQLASSDFQIQKKNNQYLFITKGSGHGVGMSQCGAQGMAKEGYHYQDILKHYYQGIEITQNKE